MKSDLTIYHDGVQFCRSQVRQLVPCSGRPELVSVEMFDIDTFPLPDRKSVNMYRDRGETLT